MVRNRKNSSRRPFSKAKRFYGPRFSSAFRNAAADAKSTNRNGPAGVFEFDAFAGGSKVCLDAAIEACENGSTVIVGGGDTATLAASAYQSLSYGCRLNKDNRIRGGRQALACEHWWRVSLKLISLL